jgi:hypothetical protein
MNVKDIFRKETGEHIEIAKEFNDGVFVDVYNDNYIAWLENKVNVTLGNVRQQSELLIDFGIETHFTPMTQSTKKQLIDMYLKSIDCA